MPWLKQPKKACQHLHFCDNKYLMLFERIGNVFLPKLNASGAAAQVSSDERRLKMAKVEYNRRPSGADCEC